MFCMEWQEKKNSKTQEKYKQKGRQEWSSDRRTYRQENIDQADRLTQCMDGRMDGMAWPGLASLHRSSHLTWGMSKNVSRQSAGWLTDGRSVGPNDRQAVRQLVTAAGECYEATIWMWTDYKPSQSRMNWDDVAAKCCYSFGFGISSSFATLKTHTHMLRSYCVFVVVAHGSTIYLPSL